MCPRVPEHNAAMNAASPHDDAALGSPSLGRRFATALAAKDEAALRAVLAEDLDFRGLTPGRPWEAGDSDQVIDVLLGHWFEPSDRIESLLEVTDGDDVADVHRVSYRLAVRNADGLHVVEQQAYYRGADRIDQLRMLCSGFRRIEG